MYAMTHALKDATLGKKRWFVLVQQDTWVNVPRSVRPTPHVPDAAIRFMQAAVPAATVQPRVPHYLWVRRTLVDRCGQ
jgi:hypothetical protein